MRVLCSTIHGADVEGEVIGGERFDPVTESCDLDSIFTFDATMEPFTRSTAGWWVW